VKQSTTRPHRARARLVAVALVLGAGVVGAIGGAGSDSPLAEAQIGTLGAGGEYHPLTPTRIFNTRTPGTNDVAPLGPKPSSPQGTSFDVDVLGQGGVPAEVNGVNTDVLAVVANVTVVGATRPGYLSITPTGAAPSGSSLVNFEVGEAVPNLAVLGVGAGGRSTITLTTPSGAGRADVLIDVFGWISTSQYRDTADSGARFVPAGPSRILDTRSGPVPFGWAGGWPLDPSRPGLQQLTLKVRGANNGVVPDNADITGVMINVTAVNDGPGTTGTFVSVGPDRTPPGVEPATSITNVGPGQIKANMAIVPLAADGTITFYNSRGATHLAVDVVGYLQRGVSESTSPRAGRVIPLQSPFRVFDTRQDAFGRAPLGVNAAELWSFQAFADSVSLGGIPVGRQSALIGNLTGTDLVPAYRGAGGSTYLTAFPSGVAVPNASNINVTLGRTVPNTSLLRYGTQGGDPYSISVFNYDGALHYLLDVYAVVLAD
jgi:hypothetical protein